MSKINISLVGGQPMPIYMGIMSTPPDTLVLVHSDQTRPEAESVKKKCGLADVRLETFPTENFQTILEKAKNLIESFKGKEITANITSGFKLWSIAFTMVGMNNENVSVIYIDQNNRYYDLLRNEDKAIEIPLGISSILDFQSQKLPSKTLFTEYTESDKNVLKSLKKIRAHNFNDFKQLTSCLSIFHEKELKQKSSSTLYLNSGSKVFFDKSSNRIDLKLVNKYGHSITRSYISPHVFDIVFFTGWFEYEVAMLLSQCKQVKEVWLNAIFPYKTGNDKNEIDIIASLGSRLLFVECKTQISQKTDLDKFKSAVQNYGGGSCMSLFVSEAKMLKETKEKCTDNKILYFSLEDSITSEKKKELKYDIEKIWSYQKEKLNSLIESNYQIINK